MAPSHPASGSGSTAVTSVNATSRVPQSTSVHAAYGSDLPSSRTTASPYHHAAPPRPDNYATYKDYHPPTAGVGVAPQPYASATAQPQSNGLAPVRKRESPLDLSVKTVKSSADSTAQDDFDPSGVDRHVSSSSVVGKSSRSSMMPLPNVHEGGRSANGLRNTGQVRASTPHTVCAPKVDFLPDFSAAPIRHQQGLVPADYHNPLRRSASQQIYPQQSNSNAAPLPHMSSFKVQHQLYKKNYSRSTVVVIVFLFFRRARSQRPRLTT